MVDHLRHALRHQCYSVIRALGITDARKQQAQIIMYFGHSANGGAGIMGSRLLLYGNGGGQAFDQIHIGLLHQLQELTRIRGKRFDVAPLPFRVEGIECEG